MTTGQTNISRLYWSFVKNRCSVYRYQLTALVPTVVGEQAVGDLFAGRAGHAAEHIISIEEGFRQGA